MSAPSASARPSDPPTVAQRFCLWGGLTLVAVGLVGFAVNGSFDPDKGSDLIVFMVNGWHDLVHLLSGLLLLAGVGHRRRAEGAALLFGVAYGVVTVWGLAGDQPVLGLFHTDGADNALHV